ncbi:hypothetical protein Bbelb_105740 [Branchiostoma belcheri]|nr:hypothetical protein Bbelb_105740 [Branchiostoma belcheri]
MPRGIACPLHGRAVMKRFHIRRKRSALQCATSTGKKLDLELNMMNSHLHEVLLESQPATAEIYRGGITIDGRVMSAFQRAKYGRPCRGKISRFLRVNVSLQQTHLQAEEIEETGLERARGVGQPERARGARAALDVINDGCVRVEGRQG